MKLGAAPCAVQGAGFLRPPLRSVIPTGVADFFLRSRRANVGRGVEGPRRHVNLTTHIGTAPAHKSPAPEGQQIFSDDRPLTSSPRPPFECPQNSTRTRPCLNQPCKDGAPACPPQVTIVTLTPFVTN